jgi:hypothetical protein
VHRSGTSKTLADSDEEAASRCPPRSLREPEPARPAVRLIPWKLP